MPPHDARVPSSPRASSRQPGVSRAFVSVMGRAAPGWFPKWLSHSLSNRFLDTDVWLHDAERWARGTATTAPLSGSAGGADAAAPGATGLGGLTYALPTSSDAGTRLFRQWWARNAVADCVGFGAAQPAQLQWESRMAQFDRFHAHTASCQHCQRALRRWKRVRTAAPLAAILPSALGLPVAVRLGGVLLWLALHALSTKAIPALEGPGTPGELGARVLVADDE